MPLDKRAFLAELGMLADRFGRTVSEPVMLRYYDTLSQRLTTEEFKRASRIIFDRDKFWPEPMRFVDAVKGNATEEAAAAWNALVAAAAMGDHAAVHGATLAALRASGVTFRDVELASDARLGSIRKSFVAAFERAASKTNGQPALPAAQTPVLGAANDW